MEAGPRRAFRTGQGHCAQPREQSCSAACEESTGPRQCVSTNAADGREDVEAVDE
jgi:hypothetical protein